MNSKFDNKLFIMASGNQITIKVSKLSRNIAKRNTGEKGCNYLAGFLQVAHKSIFGKRKEDGHTKIFTISTISFLLIFTISF